MRHFLGGFCAFVAVGVVGGADAAAAGDLAAPAQKTLVAPVVRASSPGCLGGVLNEGPTRDYLTVADYPAFAANVLRFFICGDSIPPYLPAGENTGGFPRRR
jgi:hypothetical protein